MNIGIIGRARVGKDTAGSWFVEQRGYRRVALADPLKEAALRLDPIVGTDTDVLVGEGDRLADVVGYWGWERAKEVPEVRRILQELGAAMRAIDEDFWLRQALKATQEANDAGVPVVITDVRYRNEAESLRRSGFHLVYIQRPGVPNLDHESEGALTPADADDYIHNAGTLDEFLRLVEVTWDQVHAEQSRRFACKF
ncbi:hypothetical protein ACF1DV_25825 [Streptomyces achromogenes]|uniref:deoxynucleotide monophosphate kinase family protein n=1 Tax=Streptomyces achromogenes TaxID=67255 RepID=UPI0036F912C3